MENSMVVATLCGLGMRELTQNIPVTQDEMLSEDISIVKGGAAIVHLYIRDDQGKYVIDKEESAGNQKKVEIYKSADEA